MADDDAPRPGLGLLLNAVAATTLLWLLLFDAAQGIRLAVFLVYGVLWIAGCSLSAVRAAQLPGGARRGLHLLGVLPGVGHPPALLAHTVDLLRREPPT